MRVFLLFCIAFLAQASEPARIEIQPAGIVMLGSIGPREQRTISYTFHNRSATSIALKVADLPAGLTVSGPALEEPIAPHATQELKLLLDPTGRSGWLRQRVKLTTDDPGQGDYVLPLEATIRPDLVVDALRLAIPAASLHESPEAVFHFARETGEALLLRLNSPLPEHLEAEVQAHGPKSELRLILRPRKVPPGILRGLETLQVETNVGEQKRFTLYLQWSLLPVLEADPPRLVFLEGDTLELKLRRPNGQPFTLESAWIEGEGFLLPQTLDPSPSDRKQLLVKRRTVGEAHAMLVLKLKGFDDFSRIPLVSLP